MISIRGKEFDFSFTDIEHVKRLREAVNNTNNKAQDKFAKADEVYNKLDESDVVEAYDAYIELLKDGCMIYANIIDEVLGEGSANEILGKTTDLKLLTEVWQEFNEALEADAEKFGNSFKNIKPYGKKGK